VVANGRLSNGSSNAGGCRIAAEPRAEIAAASRKGTPLVPPAGWN